MNLKMTIEPTLHGNFIWNVWDADMETSPEGLTARGVDHDSGIEPRSELALKEARRARERLRTVKPN